MNAKEFRNIAKSMREFGITKAKIGDVEIEISTLQTIFKPSVEYPSPPQMPVDAPVSDSDPIKHKVEELASILKLGDNELVDVLFPEEKEQEESA